MSRIIDKFGVVLEVFISVMPPLCFVIMMELCAMGWRKFSVKEQKK